MSFGKQADEIIRRIEKTSAAEPNIDRARVENAVIAHFVALNLQPPPLRWIDEGAAGAYRAAESAAWSAARSAAWSAAWSAARSAAWSAAWSAAESAARSAAWSAAWSAAVDNYVGVWLPFVDAYEAGLWLFFPMRDEVLLVPRPVMRMVEQNLHCDDGPAVWWPRGEKYFFLNGVEVTQQIVETPAAQLDPKIILKTNNAEVRREVVRKIGIERVCEGLNAKALDREGEYELLALNLGDGRTRPYLKMLNPSIGVFHIEGVSPECRTVSQALNFRNGLTPEMIDDVNGADFIQQGDVLLFPRDATKFKSRPIQLT